jgi:hypothetical protein
VTRQLRPPRRARPPVARRHRWSEAERQEVCDQLRTSGGIDAASVELSADDVESIMEAAPRVDARPHIELALFRGAIFGDRISFRGATFAVADFGVTDFGKEANFADATFGDGANFGDALFGADANFGRATFGDKAFFDRALTKSGVVERRSCGREHTRRDFGRP